jgi:hypothetical protein
VAVASKPTLSLQWLAVIQVVGIVAALVSIGLFASP